MSNFISQSFHRVRHGDISVGTTVVKLVTASDTVELPNMSAATNSVVQLRRPGDPSVTVSQSDVNTASLTGNAGDEVLIISMHGDPVVERTEV